MKQASPGATSINPDTAKLRTERETLPDPFDPARLALKANPAEAIGVKHVQAHVAVRTPPLMRIARTSPLSGKQHAMDLPITREQLHRFTNGTLVQDAFPNLSPEEREFVLTGITPKEWDAMLPPDLVDRQEPRRPRKSKKTSSVISRTSTASDVGKTATSDGRGGRPCVQKSR
jgi:hypothetical protein